MQNRGTTYLCCFIMWAFGVVISIIGPLLTDISREFSLSMSQSGLLFTINYMGFLSFVFIGGILSERFGKKNIILISLIGLSLSLFMFGVSSKIIFAFIAIFFVGGFGSIIQSSVISLVAHLNSSNKDYFINLAQMFLCAGAASGPILIVVMMTIGNSWRINYFILSALMFILFCIVINLKVNEKPILEKTNLNNLRDILSNKRFLMICICMALYSGLELGVWGWMSTFMKKEMALSKNAAILIVSVFWISMTIGRILCGKLIKFFNIKKIIILLLLLSGFAVLLSGFLKGGVVTLLLVIAIGLSFSSIYPFLLSIGSTISSSSSSFAIIVGSGGIGIVIIPFFIGLIGDHIGMRIAMMSPCVLLFFMAFLFTLDKPKNTEGGNDLLLLGNQNKTKIRRVDQDE